MNSVTDEKQIVIDKEHLKMLSIFHFVLAGLTALVSCFFIFHIFMGWSMAHDPAMFGGTSGNAPPASIGYLFMGAGIFAMILGWTFAGLLAYAGKCIADRKHRLFILIMAGISCCNMPLGLLLGVFTLIVLFRPTVKDVFAGLPVSAELPRAKPSLDLSSVADPDEAVWKEMEEKSKKTESDMPEKQASAKQPSENQVSENQAEVPETENDKAEVIELKKMQENDT